MFEEEMQEMLGRLYPKRKKGKNNKKRIMEAGAIAAYHSKSYRQEDLDNRINKTWNKKEALLLGR